MFISFSHMAYDHLIWILKLQVILDWKSWVGDVIEKDYILKKFLGGYVIIFLDPLWWHVVWSKFGVQLRIWQIRKWEHGIY